MIHLRDQDQAGAGSPAGAAQAQGRRTFLKRLAGGAALTAGIASTGTLAGCDATTVLNLEPGGLTRAVNLGTGDFGVLNYAYALEQLEAAFYTRVVANPYSGISSEELRLLTDVRDHEVIHREFFAAAIPALGGTLIPSLVVDFSDIDFTSRESVLQTARTFEDLGVAAYNGAGQLLSNPQLLLIAGKIVSVEARHAAAIRDLLQPRTTYFAGDDIVDENGLGPAKPPSEVLMAAGPFIVNRINASGLPTT